MKSIEKQALIDNNIVCIGEIAASRNPSYGVSIAFRFFSKILQPLFICIVSIDAMTTNDKSKGSFTMEDKKVLKNNDLEKGNGGGELSQLTNPNAKKTNVVKNLRQSRIRVWYAGRNCKA